MKTGFVNIAGKAGALPTGRRSYLRRALVPSIFVGLAASGCRLLEHEVLTPSATAPLKVFVAVDNSSSYGMDSTRVRRASAPDAFAASKRRLRGVLESALDHGDEIVGVVPFTDQPVPELINEISSGSIQVDSTRMDNLRAEVNLILDDLELRPSSVAHRTAFGPVQEAALERFSETGTPLQQRILILLTDEIGSEAPGEISPESFRHAYVLVLRADHRGELRLEPNARLGALVGGELGASEDVDAATYVDAVREAYREATPVRVTRLRTDRVVLVLVGLAVAVFLGKLLIVRRNARRTAARAARRTARIDSTFFSRQIGAIVVNASNLELPAAPEDYVVDDGAAHVEEVVQNHDGRVQLVLNLEPEPGEHKLVVQARTGAVSTSFAVPPRPQKEEVYAHLARVTDLGRPKSTALHAHEVELLAGRFAGIGASLRAKRKGGDLILRRRRGRVRIDGIEIDNRHTLELSETLARTVLLDLEDENEMLELTVTTKGGLPS